MEKKQSSVEWLIDQIDFDANTRWFSQPEWFAIYQKAKAMHKEEIKEAWYNSLTKADYLSADEYYNATFEDEKKVF
jgi:hypothetical protein